MEIVVNARIKMRYDSSGWNFGDALYLHLKYKLPYRLYKVKSKVTLCHELWSGYDGSYDSFQEDILSILESEDCIESVVIQEVKKQIKSDNRDVKMHSKDDEIKKMLKSNNKFTFKIKVNNGED